MSPSSSDSSPSDDLSEFDFEFDDTSSFATYPSSEGSSSSSLVHRLYSSKNGRTYYALSDAYFCPMDEEARVLESLFHDLKHVVFGSSYPLQVSSMINRLLSRPANVEGKLEGKQPRVLDVGCGSLAVWMIDLAKKYPTVEITGLDLGAKRFSHSTPPNCVYEICDVSREGIPYPDRHFQMVNQSFLSWWCAKEGSYARLVEEIARSLDTGGVYLCIEPSCELWTESGEPLADRFPGLAAFQKIHHEALFSASPPTLDETEIIKRCGHFSRCFSETITIQLGSRSSRGVNASINLAGMNFLEMYKIFYRPWMPLLLGKTEDEADLVTNAAQEELAALERTEVGRGVRGSIFVMFAIRGGRPVAD
ncbi:hypothetical protein BDY24DRAFT_442160 [Mrakia frigida]|uniref:class I SAM-dependent methyltransferase n=1 Tax=Mrakia frigida TaxID=29902 RepID=UPI003FCBFF0A